MPIAGRVNGSFCCVMWSSVFHRELCDIGDIGKLTREQFALALHLINQKLTTGVDPPQNLSAEMIPPSDRLSLATKQVTHSYHPVPSNALLNIQ